MSDRKDDQRASPPDRRPAMSMRWQSLLFMHWPVEPTAVEPLIPEGLTLDTFDGRAWVGLIPFTMRDVRFVTPLGKIGFPTTTRFHECNVRTYVRAGSEHGSTPGVWFFSLDAASRLAVRGARMFWNLPYFHSMMTLTRRESRIEYTVSRRRSHATTHCLWEVGAPLPPSRPGELAHFLTERYALFARDRRGGLHVGHIAHDPWPLREARVTMLNDSLIGAAGVELDTDLERNPPLAHHAEALDVEAWPLERLPVGEATSASSG